VVALKDFLDGQVDADAAAQTSPGTQDTLANPGKCLSGRGQIAMAPLLLMQRCM